MYFSLFILHNVRLQSVFNIMQYVEHPSFILHNVRLQSLPLFQWEKALSICNNFVPLLTTFASFRYHSFPQSHCNCSCCRTLKCQPFCFTFLIFQIDKKLKIYYLPMILKNLSKHKDFYVIPHRQI